MNYYSLLPAVAKGEILDVESPRCTFMLSLVTDPKHGTIWKFGN
jgi:hypothetical protein